MCLNVVQQFKMFKKVECIQKMFEHVQKQLNYSKMQKIKKMNMPVTVNPMQRISKGGLPFGFVWNYTYFAPLGSV